MTTHIMLDIETLGLIPGKNAIVSIGMVTFYADGWVDLYTPTETFAYHVFYAEINIEAQEQYGLRADPETIKWWSKPEHPRFSFDVMLRAYHNKTGQEIWEVLPKVDAFIRQYDEPFIWSNPSTFDGTFMHETYKAVPGTVAVDPWSHRQDMCYRTLKRLRPDIPTVETPGAKHHAYYDALDQARHAQQILHAMGVF